MLTVRLNCLDFNYENAVLVKKIFDNWEGKNTCLALRKGQLGCHRYTDSQRQRREEDEVVQAGAEREREITQKTDPGGGEGGGEGAVQEQPEGGDQERQVVSEGTLVSRKKQVQT